MIKNQFQERTDDVKSNYVGSFDTMLLKNYVLDGLNWCDYKKPSPIQSAAIPLARCGLDLIVQAKSGTGKTLVFTVAILESLLIKQNFPQAVVLAPTREIAVQIADVIENVGYNIPNLKVSKFIGGVPMLDDKKVAKCQIVVGTPGRVRHLIELSVLDVSSAQMFVLDEADKLLESSFLSDINYIFNHLNKSKQTIACSATYTKELLEFVNRYMRMGTHVTPHGVPSPVLIGIKQFALVTADHPNVIARMKRKEESLLNILNKVKFDQCVIFSNYTSRAKSLSIFLERHKLKNVCLIGSENQQARLNMISDFKSHRVRILVSSDLAARGIDASSVNLVVNFDCPKEVATYLHRMGRAGRYGSYGICITIVSEGQEKTNYQQLLSEVGSGISVNIAEKEHLLEIWTAPEDTYEKLGPKARKDSEMESPKDSETESIEMLSSDDFVEIEDPSASEIEHLSNCLDQLDTNDSESVYYSSSDELIHLDDLTGSSSSDIEVARTYEITSSDSDIDSNVDSDDDYESSSYAVDDNMHYNHFFAISDAINRYVEHARSFQSSHH